MRWKIIISIGVACLIAAAAVAEPTDGDRLWFGLGGSMLGVAFADLSAVDAVLRDSGFGTFGDAVLFTGARVRGGALYGPSIGAIGWSGERAAVAGDRYAELSLGFGGLELGWAIGGNERSLLTVGVVLGGGGTSLSLVGGTVGSLGTCGVVPEPIVRSGGGALLAAGPFVSLQVQPLHNFGFEVHLGYLLELLQFTWGDPELEDGLARLTGPTIGFTATWGAIGRPAIGPIVERATVEETVEETVSLAGVCVEINNPAGRVTIETGQAVGERPEVRILATKRAFSASVLEGVSVLIELTRCGLTVHSAGPRRGFWEIDYTVVVPPGTEVAVEQGTGDVRLTNVAGSASIALGLGDVEIHGMAGPALAIECGAGDVRMDGIAVETIDLVVGIGDLAIALPVDASYTVDAWAGIGEIVVGPFGEAEAIEAGGIGGRVEATFGRGEAALTARLAVGEITVLPEE